SFGRADPFQGSRLPILRGGQADFLGRDGPLVRGQRLEDCRKAGLAAGPMVDPEGLALVELGFNQAGLARAAVDDFLSHGSQNDNTRRNANLPCRGPGRATWTA